MLTEDEKNYLAKIPADKKVVVRPYDPRTKEIAQLFIDKIHSVEPNLEVAHLGASALGISGQGDIDLSVLCSKESFEDHKTNISKVFGETVLGISLVTWKIQYQGFEVEVYLADPKDESTARQIKFHNILKTNSKLLKEYEEIKELAADLPYRDYQRKKYEFYNKVLEE